MKLWIGNLDPATTEEELQAFLTKYGGPQIATIEHVPGDGTRPAAMITFEAQNIDKLYRMAQRLNGLRWKDRELVAHVLRS
jgi:hypothetical protein